MDVTARLQAAARPNSIVVGEETYARVAPLFEARPLEPIVAGAGTPLSRPGVRDGLARAVSVAALRCPSLTMAIVHRGDVVTSVTD